MNEYWTPRESKSDIVTPLCKCGGLILDGKCAHCGKASKVGRKAAKPKFKAYIGLCPGCQRETKISSSGYCPSCNLHGKQHEEQMGETEARMVIRAAYERVRIRMGIGGTRLG